jgi:hypothetical protein
MAVSKGSNLWRGFGLAQSPKHDLRLNRQRFSRAIFFASLVKTALMPSSASGLFLRVNRFFRNRNLAHNRISWSGDWHYD